MRPQYGAERLVGLDYSRPCISGCNYEKELPAVEAKLTIYAHRNSCVIVQVT